MRRLPVFFSLALLGSALLSFSVQPILGKILLPMVGGAPAGWIVALAFFQLSLLAGYGVSYFLGRYSPWVHAAGLLALYVAGICFLPPHLPPISSDMHGADLSFAVTEALFKAIFVPFIALTATTAALQRVFAASKHETAADPYYLFVASNIGSFAGLLIYPFLLEPFVGISVQTHWWRIIYLTVIGLIALATVMAYNYRRPIAQKAKKKDKKSAVTMKQISMWTALAFVPCSLSMGVTTMITADLGGFPLFWVAPLGLYLLTFVLAFARKKLIAPSELAFWHQVAVVVYFIATMIAVRGMSWDLSMLTFIVNATILMAIFFVTAWACHQRLADMRPHTDHLPQFYFILALGGGLAGIMHAFILPYILDGVYEFSIVIILSLLLNSDWSAKFKKIKFGNIKDITNILMAAAVVLLAIVTYMTVTKGNNVVTGIFLACFTLLYFFFSLRPKQALILSTAVFLVMTFVMKPEVMVQDRNFFGTWRVAEVKTKDDLTLRYFTHGSTLHGMAILDKDGKLHGDSFGYYLHGGPIDHVMQITNAKEVGVLGLGTGQLACFSKTATTDFFEIDPDILTMAEKYFPYLDKCKPRKVFIGDGRLEIAKSKIKYDVILQDAFTSDGIPMHLLTEEAFADYKTKITPKGIILFHISNRYLNLAPPLAATAEAVGLQAYMIFHHAPKDNVKGMDSRWVAVPMNAQQGAALEKRGWKRIETKAQPWTDDKSSLISALSLTF